MALFDPRRSARRLLEEPRGLPEKTRRTQSGRPTVLDSNASPQSLDYVEYTRTTRASWITFPRLENPDLVIYVYPTWRPGCGRPIPATPRSFRYMSGSNTDCPESC